MEVPDVSSILGRRPSARPTSLRREVSPGRFMGPGLLVLLGALVAESAYAQPVADAPRGARPKGAPTAEEIPLARGTGPAALPIAKQLSRPGKGRVAGGDSFALRLGPGRTRAGFVVSFDAVGGWVNAAQKASEGGAPGLPSLLPLTAPGGGLGPVLQVPSSVVGQPVEYEWLALAGGERLLILSFGHDPAYQLLLLGAPSGETEPQLALKGFVGASTTGLVELSRVGKTGEQILLLTRSPLVPNLCGRVVPTSVQKLDPNAGDFVRVAIPALRAAERRGPLELQATVLPGSGEPGSSASGGSPALGGSSAGAEPQRTAELEVSLAPMGAGRMPGPGGRWIDGRRDEVAPPHGAIELTRLSGAPFKGLLVHSRRDDGSRGRGPGASEASVEERADLGGGGSRTGAGSTSGRELFILTERQVFSVRLPEGGESSVFVPLPEELREGCLAVAQGSTAWVSEVTAVVAAPPAAQTSPPAIARALDGALGDLAARVLLAWGPEASPLLSAEVRRLGPVGRRRGEQIAEAWGAQASATYAAQLLAVGNEDEARRALESLRAAGDLGLPALASALKSARPAEEVRLAEAIAELAPERAPAILIRQLDQPAAARRLEIRKILASTCRNPAALRAAEKILADSHHSRRSRSELLRALAPHMAALRPESQKTALALLESARFHEAYRLTPVLLALAGQEEAPRKLAEKWLDGSAPSLSPRERAALRVQLLTVALDQGLGHPFLMDRAAGLLPDAERRVREVSARYLQEFPGSQAAEPLASRARSDDWPEVRGQALLALAELRPQPQSAAVAEEAILRALRRDAEPSVRAAAAHGLDRAPNEQSSKALRRALRRDDASLVRAEAARSLGLICDQESLEPLTQLAQAMRHGVADEADVRLGLEAAAAVARLSPPDLDARLAPLLSEDVPGALRARVEQAISPARGMCATQPAQ